MLACNKEYMGCQPAAVFAQNKVLQLGSASQKLPACQSRMLQTTTRSNLTVCFRHTQLWAIPLCSQTVGVLVLLECYFSGFLSRHRDQNLRCSNGRSPACPKRPGTDVRVNRNSRCALSASFFKLILLLVEDCTRAFSEVTVRYL